MSLFTITKGNVAAAAVGPTTGVVPAGAEVSAATAALFAAHVKAYQSISAQAAAFEQQLQASLKAAERKGSTNFNQISATTLNNMVCYTDDMNSIKQEHNSGDNKMRISSRY